MKKIKIKINDKTIECFPDKTIMEVAKENEIFIPGFCGHPDFPPKGNCRVCVVEIKGHDKLAISCQKKVQAGMEIFTNTDRVKKARNLNIELLFAEHIEKCPTCIWRVNCRLLDYAEKYKIEITRFSERKAKRKTYKFANAVEIDGSQCIDCRNCLDACNMMQKINYLELKGKGLNQEIVPVKDKKVDCIYCGQCAVHCPVGAAQEQTNWEAVEKLLKKKSKVIVAQFAPSIRVSIGEEFSLPYGKIMTGKIVAGLRALGFNYIFDVNFGADITTIVEAEELLERVKISPSMPSITRGGKKRVGLPMMTSCCPAWVKYVEFYNPELIPNLTTARSPHIHSGGAIKTFWAESMNIKPKDIIVVSVMPCTAKKFEISRPELKIKGEAPVDYVLTTREFAWLMKKNEIDFKNLKSKPADNPLGEYSGAAAIYGGSGGVMESALRTANAMICKTSKICAPKLEFKEVRGLDGIKEASMDIGRRKLKVAVVNGIGNIKPVIENLDNYDYIEVMACPGGCIGGGGQPIPTDNETRQKRIEALYKIDKGQDVRRAHENKGVQEMMKWLRGQKGDLEHKVLHTKYKKRK